MPNKKDKDKERIPVSFSPISLKRDVGVFSNGLAPVVDIHERGSLGSGTLGTFHLTDKEKEIIRRIMEMPITRRVCG